MKRVILLFVLCMGLISSHAQTQADSDKESVRYNAIAAAHYQMIDFDAAKYSSFYGIGTFATSFIHWNFFHIGANLVFSMNYGIADSAFETTAISFGPSVRFDISKSCFINIPVNACWSGDWCCQISPALHLFPGEGKIGIFVGPQLSFASVASFGMVAGLSYAF